MRNIQIVGAREGNLQNISLEIPRDKLVVFTGLSGSGKSTLLLDVLFNECQRQYLEAMAMEGIRKPQVERIRGASPAIYISQGDANRNPRSTVGTKTDLYTDLRMIYEKLGERSCPHCGAHIAAADCREETEKRDGEFYVYMYCCRCGQRMRKLTRTDFSFNTREGACLTCAGLGSVHTVRREAAVDEALALEDGAVRCWEKQYAKYQLSLLYRTYAHYGLPAPAHQPVAQFSALQRAILYEGSSCALVRQVMPDCPPPKTAGAGRFEGVVPNLQRRLAEKSGDAGSLEPFFEHAVCPDCRGQQLGPTSRAVTVRGTRLPQLAQYTLQKLCRWAETLRADLPRPQLALVADYLLDIETKLGRLRRVGLDYLTLQRQVVSLSGGERQRLRLAAALDCDLSGLLYILDEPTAGLHPRDTAGLVDILKKLRDLGNTVLVIEHDPDVMAAADYLIDMGPGAGRHGGQVVSAGTPADIARQDTATGRCLRRAPLGKTQYRAADGAVDIGNAVMHNLQGLDLRLPCGCLVAVTGPSGSGKSTLVFEVLAKGQPDSGANAVRGRQQFAQVVEVRQGSIARMKRSNVATYCGVYSEIRALYARTEEAKKAGLGAGHFSFNSPGGRCEACQGMGRVDSNLLFFTDAQVVCPVCGGRRFSPAVLAVKLHGLSISEVLDLSVEEAAVLFEGCPKVAGPLKLLQEVGLGYLQLGQALTTLSGGEGQRLKLARELIASRQGEKTLYLMDEPTAGLHPQDIDHFLALLDRLVDAGNTVVVVEHNPQLIKSCDWVIDLGPDGGDRGGQLIFAGTPAQLRGFVGSATAAYL
ncbi:excinuclease ABC subunit UvrA [Neobittarella massiliensis]|uniref:UvrABC system protein A n=1 Tax=Neobittarella massiliensis (ex Bilen et al. 2018) TaxID=2041842 RepID=A0A8J6IP73_9FIRM|nr:excinuclease ABC subunit UvrA [Neobittarella massiliensis]MBC3515601.1 excinuclease ABC subunit UvrA [Neobittarella massiliensis]